MGILIVDDNEANLFVIEKLLGRAGYTDTLSFTSAQDMFTYLLSDNPFIIEEQVDVILMDIMMPEMDGIEACRKLQSIPHLKDIPVIFVTALEDTSKVVEALDAGGMDYLMKPIKKTELLARLRVALRLKYEKDWHKKQEEKISNELELSMNVQTSLLSEPIEKDNLLMKASYSPAFKLAGDMYYWYEIDENRYAAILLDMMGHGISASLVCMFISSVLRDSIRSNPDPEYVIPELNRWMNSLNIHNQKIPYYFTGIYLVIDTSKRTVEYINAGHPSGYALVDGQLADIASSTCAIGFFEEIKAEKQILSYNESVQLLIFTDGVYEAVDKYEEAGISYLKTAAASFMSEARITEPIDLVLTAEQQATASDDMCVILIQCH
ncbi:sigma-B regulation protein RsbU (phosphoserine phosphatase) [Peribacillus deserti]|uniref:Sigma-B regulation protein RsbU (Phosphoserine phosphatase) n=1 Tax=Peribacillus deserti TaxID=673318 RepID=A0ABS2QEC4_9BACI|nr:SpoIIE family protein phosphatase [Peribacillus deserti]MBM7691483.1 sigma-B regulation protein RsbU (phosphoserine phosphatase) [Peribacillus deserti]